VGFGPDFFVFRNSLVIGRVVKGFKADVIRSSFFGTKNSRFFHYYAYYVQILIALLRKRHIYCRRQTFIDSTQILTKFLFAIAAAD